jgi:NNP family nitrate/nitrite transporter-like MFS transporter
MTIQQTGVGVPVAEPSPADEAWLLQRREHRWIDRWEPEDVAFWQAVGAKTARRNLTFSILSEHIGFSVWTIWSVMVLFMPASKYGFSVADKFLITTTPAAVGAVMRLPYTFAVAKFGGRNWTVISALLLLIPTLIAAIILKPGVSLGTVVIVAGLAGVGGGNFASSMSNINNYYPQRLKGRALGLNAGGGNIGVATVQIVGAIVIATAGATVDPRIMLYIYMPLIVIVAALGWTSMDNLTEATNDKGAMREVTKNKHTWIISFLYIGTFGSFIGFGFAFGQVLAAAGEKHPIYYVWIGAFVGSLIRPVGGMLADRFKGSTVSLWNFVAMVIASIVVLITAQSDSLPVFIVSFTVLFALTGIGNGSVYKMIPAIFHARAIEQQGQGVDAGTANFQARRLGSALVGLAGMIGAAGGVLVQLAFRQSFLSQGNGNAAYIAFIAFYVVCAVVTWFFYVRSSSVSKLIGV